LGVPQERCFDRPVRTSGQRR